MAYIDKKRLNDLVTAFNDGRISGPDYEELGRTLTDLANIVLSKRDILLLLDSALEKEDLAQELVLHMLTHLNKVHGGNAYAYLYGMCVFELGVRLASFKRRQNSRIRNMHKIRKNFGESISDDIILVK